MKLVGITVQRRIILNGCSGFLTGYWFYKSERYYIAWNCQSGPHYELDVVGGGSCYSCTGSPCWPFFETEHIDSSGAVTAMQALGTKKLQAEGA